MSQASMLTPEMLINKAWSLQIPIFEIGAENLPDGYLDACCRLAKTKEIDVRRINLLDVSVQGAALVPEAFQLEIEAINRVSSKTLLVFENADCLAPLDCSLTYTLRSVLTTRDDGLIVSIFTASSDAMRLLFDNPQAAFYQSSCRLC